MKAHPARCTSVRRRAELWRRLHPLCLFVQSRQLVSRWESNPPLSNGGKRLTHRVSAARRIAIISPMAWDPDTRPTRTTSRARRLPAHALRRISSTFCASDRRSGGASPRQALAWRCQRRRYGWTTQQLFACPSCCFLIFMYKKQANMSLNECHNCIGIQVFRFE